ncbi:MAG TPA: substrate-binding domain-containing protein, partial [Anaerolineae bacterium]|nr:substrate-binding domain-containing protein [Anaerolineae bacterium]
PVARQAGHLILSTTTSTYDSGLLGHILPEFEAANNCKVDIVSVGTGQSIQIGRDGNCDVVLVHSRALEDKFVADGFGINRLDVMYNDFIIVGPANDPAGIKGMKEGAAALKKIADGQAMFISRGDGSGTDVKEKELWAAVNIKPSGAWYVSAGQGMGAVLNMANERLAYTLADRGTYLAQKGKLELVILMEGDKAMFNPYGVIAVNPAKYASVNADLAKKFQEWLTSVPVQEKIAGFGVAQYGQPLFYPDSQAYRDAKAGSAVAALVIKGKVEKELALSLDALQALGTIKWQAEHPKKGMQDFEGVLFKTLLAHAAAKSDAKEVVLTAGDGFAATIALADAACDACGIAIKDGVLSGVFSGQPSSAWVKDIRSIEFK